MRLAVVSPFLDRRHGTELCIIEQIERLAYRHHWDIQLYSQRVEDVAGLSIAASHEPAGGSISWHKVSEIPGPHLIQFLWWFLANNWQRSTDARNSRHRTDCVYSPGINCSDADAIMVHIVFHEFYRRVRSELRFSRLPLSSWPRTLHRKLYYRLIMFLESRVYSDPNVSLAAVSQMVANQLATHFGRSDVTVIRNAVDTAKFNAAARVARRYSARDSFGYSQTDFVLLLIGNDWKKKGLDQLLRALLLNHDLPMKLLVAGRDNPALYHALLRETCTTDLVQFASPTSDVLALYAAADAYAGPSLEDAFGLPIIEAMACGLPVVASAYAGASEIIEDGCSGLILRHPENAEQLAALLRRLFLDEPFRERLGMAAARVAANHGWDENARQCLEFLKTSKSAASPRI